MVDRPAKRGLAGVAAVEEGTAAVPAAPAPAWGNKDCPEVANRPPGAADELAAGAWPAGLDPNKADVLPRPPNGDAAAVVGAVAVAVEAAAGGWPNREPVLGAAVPPPGVLPNNDGVLPGLGNRDVPVLPVVLVWPPNNEPVAAGAPDAGVEPAPKSDVFGAVALPKRLPPGCAVPVPLPALAPLGPNENDGVLIVVPKRLPVAGAAVDWAAPADEAGVPKVKPAPEDILPAS